MSEGIDPLKYMPLAYTMAKQACKRQGFTQAADVADAKQEAMLALLKAHKDFREEGRTHTHQMGLFYHFCKKRIRWALSDWLRTHRVVVMPNWNVKPTKTIRLPMHVRDSLSCRDESPEAAAERNSEFERLFAAIELLKPSRREIIKAYYLDDTGASFSALARQEGKGRTKAALQLRKKKAIADLQYILVKEVCPGLSQS